MKEIQLNKGFVALVDESDYERLSVYKWSVRNGRNGVMYAFTNMNCSGKLKIIHMHRFIFNVSDSEIFVDHINHDGLDNRKENLRIASPSQNSANRRAVKGRASKYLGVYLVKRKYKDKESVFWAAEISKKYLGIYKTEEEAAIAYDVAANNKYGRFANLNFKKGHDSILININKSEPSKNSSKMLIDLETGIYYKSIREAAKAKCIAPTKMHYIYKQGDLCTMSLALC